MKNPKTYTKIPGDPTPTYRRISKTTQKMTRSFPKITRSFPKLPEDDPKYSENFRSKARSLF